MKKQTDIQKTIENVITNDRGYGNPKPIEFYDKDRECPECLDFIEKLGTNLVPFDCKHMRILFQYMKVYREKGPSMKYKKGELLCLISARKKTSRRCKLSNKILPIDGEFEVLCREGIYKFKLKKIK